MTLAQEKTVLHFTGKTVGLIVLQLLFSGCLAASERLREAEKIDGRLFYRYQGYRGIGGIDSRWEKDKDALREAVNKYLKDNSEVDPNIKGHLEKLEITIGMTKDQVKLLWGEPHRSIVSDKNPPAEKESERWFYDRNVMMLLFPWNSWFYELRFDADHLSQIIFWDPGQPF